ncbi:glutamate 5-kinase [Crenothrix sp.]|uniref:glutamate 5-kinase n=1 Tax=Crenothrix sp. TaxID=3100433 RepID=UPI00374DDF9D
MSRSEFVNTKRVVIKIGSSLLTCGGQGLDKIAIAAWVKQMAGLKLQGIDVVLVSSGAVAEGMCRLNLKVRPKTLHELQAAAAIGQMGLVRVFDDNFQQHDLHAAQILLTHDDLSNRKRYLNARSTLLTLINFGAVPIINENDTVATEEIRFGDNDTLAALVANLIEADLLIILTDQKGLFTSDPSVNPDATLISEISVNDTRLESMAGESRSGLGRGGMYTKVRAARLASRSGAATIVAAGIVDDVIKKVLAGENLGTHFLPDAEPLVSRKRWLAGQLQLKGQLTLDSGAARALKNEGKSLLSVGVKVVLGQFERGELVACVDEAGVEIARGLINYSKVEAQLIAGKNSSEFESILGYLDDRELIHRDNMVLI